MASSSQSKTARAASALKSGVGGVVLGGTAIFSAMNGFTPHMAGAIDIMVVEQPDGSLKCSPFYVRFGKYAPMRAKDKTVRISVNGDESPFSMHLGAYGQAYFTAETTEFVSDADDDDDVLSGMMSPPSGYSSGDEGAPYANEAILSAVKEEVERLKRVDSAAGQQAVQEAAAGEGTAGGPMHGDQEQQPAGMQQQELQGEQQQPEPHQVAGSHDEQHRPLSRLAVSSKASDGGGVGGESGEESSSELSGSSSSESEAPFAGPRPPQSAAPLPPLPPPSPHRQRRSTGSERVGSGAAAAAGSGAAAGASSAAPVADVAEAAAAAAVASAAAKARLLAQPLAQPGPGRLEDMLLDSKYSVTSANSDTLNQLQPQQAPVPERVQHAWAVRRRSASVQARIDGEEGEPSDRAAAEGDEAPAEGADAGEETASTAVIGTAAEVAAGVQQQPWEDGAAAGTRPAGLPPRPQARKAPGLLSTAVNGASQAPDADGASVDAAVDVHSRDGDLEASSSGSGKAGEVGGEAAGEAPLKVAGEAAVGQSQLQQDLQGGSSASEEGEEVTSPLKPPTTGQPAGLLASSIKAHDEAKAAASAAKAAAAVVQGGVADVTKEAAGGAPAAGAAPTAGDASAPSSSQEDGAASQAPMPAASQPVPIAIPATGARRAAPDAPLGVSPGDAGYLADSEEPRGGGAGSGVAELPSMAAGAVPQTHSGAMALGGQGFQMSLCGHLLRRGTPAAEALQLFEAHRVTAATWASSGGQLWADASLVVKVGGALYPWSAAGPMVMGMLAFGGPWHDTFLQGADEDAWHPLRVHEERPGQSKKGSDAGAPGGATPTGSSWRLWPFSSWRDGAVSVAPAAGASISKSALASAIEAVAGSGGSVAAGAGSPRASKAAAVSAAGAAGGATPPQMGSSPPMSSLLSVAAAAGLSLPLSRTGSFGGASSASMSPRRRAAAAAAAAAAASAQQPRPRRHIVIIRKTLIPTPEQLASLPLRFGSNTIEFRCSAGGTASLSAYVYYYPWNARLVISDVDGTITRSDLLGHVLPSLGVDWSHAGITQLFHNIAANGYQIMFLSSRAIAQANITRDYLHKLVQNGYKMPGGPVIISPHGLLPSLYREIVQRRPHEFKIACLEDIRALFPPDWNPFYAGFGNRDTDVLSYKEIGVPAGRVFIINPKGQICKGSAVLQSSTWSSLSAINQLVDEVFPAVQEMLDIMRGAAGGMRAAAKAVLVAERLRKATSGGGASTSDQQAGDHQQDGEQQEQQQDQQQDGLGEHQLAKDGSGMLSGLLVGARSGGSGGGGGSPPASEAGSQGGGVAPAHRCARLVGPSAMPPQRDEFNDAQYWRPSISFDIEAELRVLESQASSKSSSRRVSQAGEPSSFSGLSPLH